jgi:hypothetical protein
MGLCLKLILALVSLDLLSCFYLGLIYFFVSALEDQFLGLAYLSDLAIVIKESCQTVIALVPSLYKVLINKLLLALNVIVVLLCQEPFLNRSE